MTTRFRIDIAPDRDAKGLWPMRLPARVLVELGPDRTIIALSYLMAPHEPIRSIGADWGVVEIGARSGRFMRASVKIAVKRALEIERVCLKVRRSLEQLETARDPLVADHYGQIIELVLAEIEKTVEDGLSPAAERREISSVVPRPRRPSTRS